MARPDGELSNSLKSLCFGGVLRIMLSVSMANGGYFRSGGRGTPNRTPSNHRKKQSLGGVVAREGIEPPTRGFSVRCSTN